MLFALNVVSVLTVIDAPVGSALLLQTHTDHTQMLPQAGGVRHAQARCSSSKTTLSSHFVCISSLGCKKPESRVLDESCGVFFFASLLAKSVRGVIAGIRVFGHQ